MRGWTTALLPLIVVVASGCGQRRFYPLMAFQPTEDPTQRLDLSGVALTDAGLVVAVDENDSSTLFELSPVDDAGATRSVDPRGGEWVDLFELTDPSQDCPTEPRRRFQRCRNNTYRARVTMTPRTIDWLPGSDGQVIPPHHIEDLAPYPCPTGVACEARVLGVTEFSTIGRVTGFREDKVPGSREQTERLFLLERRPDGWQEVLHPGIDRLRQHLSDWGRATCEDDMVVEGLAYDPDGRVVYVGLNRCLGPVQRVLAYPLGLAEAGGPAVLEVVADGIKDQWGNSVAGPSEGLSSLDFAYGQLWATSSWDDYGYPNEPVYGGRLLARTGGHLAVVPLPGPIEDRADALAVLRHRPLPPGTGGSAEAVVPWVSALVLFDNDYAYRRGSRPNGTLVHASTPAPAEGRHAALVRISESPLGDRRLGLNGFDFRWYWRDHRLGQMGVVVDRQPSGPGAWTSALGGLWQVRLGTLAESSRPVLGKAMGHNVQAAEVTDFAPSTELTFRGYRAEVSVVPRERSGEEVSVARVLRESATDYDVYVPLPRTAAADAGLVLQGFTIDTSPRAAGGICLSAMDLSVAWPGDDRDGVMLRAALLGGLCNDFNAQEAEEHHGLTTDAGAGVRVTLYFAVVEGAPARRGSLVVAQATVPDVVRNKPSKDNLACLRVDDQAHTALPRGPHRHELPNSPPWLVDRRGDLPVGEGSGRGGALSGFAFAFDLRGFDPALYPDAYASVTELTARSQNVYLYRYLLRGWITGAEGVFVEGGMSHGLHVGGLGKDNAMPTALGLRADLTWWEGLSGEPVGWIAADNADPRHDPNLQPEDGYLRWAWTTRLPPEGPSCLPR